MAIKKEELDNATKGLHDKQQEWSNWSETINDRSGIALLSFLKEYCEYYQATHSAYQKRFDKKKTQLVEENRTNIKAVENTASRERSSVEEQYKKEKNEAEKSVKEIDAHENTLNAYVAIARATANGLGKIVGKIIPSSIEDQTGNVERAQAVVQQAREKLLNAIEEQKKQATLLRERSRDLIDADSEIGKEKEIRRYNNAFGDLQSESQNDRAEIEDYFEVLLSQAVSDERVHDYRNVVESSVPSIEKFSCASTVPDFVYFGELSLDIARKESLHPEIYRRFIEQASSVVSETIDGRIVANIPYCQQLSAGISLFLSYSPTERTKYQEYLKGILLKMFMAFPAGKLEATMIDPLELGGTFSIFSKLGEEQSRIINTRAWSQEKDITEVINELRRSLETMTQTFGDDKDARLRKQPVRVLAITDFPTGFSQNALRDLQAIVRKSADYGVCIFIWANTDEVSKLQSYQQSIFSEIKQNLHTVITRNGEVFLENSIEKELRVDFDKVDNMLVRSGEIINELCKGIHKDCGDITRFTEMYDKIDDPNSWFAENSIDELSIPIGIKGANTVVKLIVGRTEQSTAHHTLIAGQTGVGKSTLLHTIIMSTLLNYSPDEAQLYLLDFKKGVAFDKYSKFNLPSIRVIAVDCEREFGLNILRDLLREMNRRFDVFKREVGCEEISEYRKARKVKLPKILVIFDELQELFRNEKDAISTECSSLLEKLLTLGRAAGIHFILASQNFDLIPSIKSVLMSHAAIRIAIRAKNGSTEDSARSVLGDSNPAAKDRGGAVFNEASGKESANVVFQVAKIDDSDIKGYLEKLNAIQNNDAFSRKYPDKTRVLLTSAEDDIFCVFNQLIINKAVIALDREQSEYHLTIGDGFDIKRRFDFSVSPKKGENILIIGTNEKIAASIFYHSILSLLYGELCNKDAKKDNQLIQIVDLSVEEQYSESGNTNFEHLEEAFNQQITSAKMAKMNDLLSSTYDTLERRRTGQEDTKERLFLLVFGINRGYKLIKTDMYESQDEEMLSPLSMLNEIIKFGPQFGINVIVWGETLSGTAKIIGATIDSCFAHRIAFSTDQQTMESFVMETDMASLRETTAVYMNVENDVKNTHFRPYEIPTQTWVNRIAKAYREFE